MPAKINKLLPYASWDCPKSVTLAFKNLYDGTATEEQQKLLLNWLLEFGCRVNDMDWFPSGDRDSCFAAGRRFVGQQIVRQIKLKVGQMKEK